MGTRCSSSPHRGDARTLVHVQPCLDWADWRVVPWTACSPLHSLVLMKGRSHKSWGVAMKQRGPAMEPLVAATHQCFWRLPVTVLRKIAKAEGIPLPKGAS